MEYFRRTILTEQLNADTLKQLLNRKMSRFYLGYLSVTMSSNQDKLVQSNISLIKQYV